MNKSCSGVSVVVPTMGFVDSVEKILKSITNQTKQPDEVILIDSSDDLKINELAEEYKTFLNIRVIKVHKAYPGEARNIGAMNVKNNVIAFLDSKTVPNKDWIEIGTEILSKGEYKVVFGSTFYKAITEKQRVLQACIFGLKPVVSTPGTILHKETFNEIGKFLEGLRAADDLEWRNRVINNAYIQSIPSNSKLIYSQISESYLDEAKRQFIYQLHGAYVDVQVRTKTVMLGILLMFLTLIIPQWNALVGWENSNLYIPNITKSYFYLVSFLSILLLLVTPIYKEVDLIFKFLLAIIFLLSSYLVYQWNFVMAKWVEESIFFIPHITKIYLVSVITSAILFRGIYKPLSMGITSKYLFPINWLKVGVIGFFLDLAKLPGYFLGAILALMRRII
jgi:glycosyltransferase involved in cell wall biosynthesis